MVMRPEGYTGGFKILLPIRVKEVVMNGIFYDNG
jgi:hypothetical protein